LCITKQESDPIILITIGRESEKSEKSENQKVEKVLKSLESNKEASIQKEIVDAMIWVFEIGIADMPVTGSDIEIYIANKSEIYSGKKIAREYESIGLSAWSS